MADDDITQQQPIALAPLDRDDPLQALVDALTTVQLASRLMLDAAKNQAHPEVEFAAHDACAWWLVAHASFQRLAIRARIGSVPDAVERVRLAKRVLNNAFWQLDDRLAVALVAMSEPDVRQTLDQLKTSLALAAGPLPPDGLDTPRAAIGSTKAPEQAGTRRDTIQ